MSLSPLLTAGPGWTVRSGPQSPVDRETLWYDWALGINAPRPAPWVSSGEPGSPEPPAAVDPPALLAAPGRSVPWPVGRWKALRENRFPYAGAQARGDVVDLVTLAVAATRRDPSDPYNDHRGYASPRCLFPVHALVGIDDEWHLVDPARRRLIATGAAAPWPAIALTGEFRTIPTSYGWFSGSLVCLETGILLRHLAALTVATGVRLRLHLPGAVGDVDTVWREPAAFSPAVVATLDDGPPRAARPRPVPSTDGDHVEPAVTDVERVYGAHRFADGCSSLPPGVPHTTWTADASWSEVLWRRSAGRMPRGLWGFRVAARGLDRTAAATMQQWAAAAPPSCWTSVAQHLRVRLLVREVDGLRPGVHHLVGDELVADPTLGADAVQQALDSYLYASSESSRNDMHRAPAVWLISGHPRGAVQKSGPAGWSLLLQSAGWVAHGLSLGAASHDLLARPVRAFDERRLADALDLAPDEMPVLGVVVGHHQPHGGTQIDLRS